MRWNMSGGLPSQKKQKPTAVNQKTADDLGLYVSKGSRTSARLTCARRRHARRTFSRWTPARINSARWTNARLGQLPDYEICPNRKFSRLLNLPE